MALYVLYYIFQYTLVAARKSSAWDGSVFPLVWSANRVTHILHILQTKISINEDNSLANSFASWEIIMPNFEKNICSIYAAEMYKTIFGCVGEFYDNPTYSTVEWSYLLKLPGNIDANVAFSNLISILAVFFIFVAKKISNGQKS